MSISIVFLVLLVAKIFNIADISWFWVFSPLIALMGLIAILFVFAFIVAVLKDIFK